MGRVIVIGSTGMLGRAVTREINPTLAYNSSTHDFRNVIEVDDFAASLRPTDIVINCVGFLRQNMGEYPSPEVAHDAFVLNAYLPAVLSQRCRLIHPSTDCVFSGRVGPYSEESLPDGEDLYARTKALGDCLTSAMTLRTSIIGLEDRGHKGLMAWFLQQKEAKGFVNHFWNGVTTNTLAKIIAWVIKNDYWTRGLWHIYSPDKTTKFQLLWYMNQYRPEPAKLTPTEASQTVNRCLISSRPNWWGNLVPTIKEQIAEAMQVG